MDLFFSSNMFFCWWEDSFLLCFPEDRCRKIGLFFVQFVFLWLEFSGPLGLSQADAFMTHLSFASLAPLLIDNCVNYYCGLLFSTCIATHNRLAGAGTWSLTHYCPKPFSRQILRRILPSTVSYRCATLIRNFSHDPFFLIRNLYNTGAMFPLGSNGLSTRLE